MRDKSFERDEGSVGRLAEFMAIEGSCCEGKRETIRDSRDHSGSPLPVCLCPRPPSWLSQVSEQRKHVSSWGCRIVLLERGGLCWASLVAELVKNPPAMQETWVRSLGWEDPLEKGKATHSSILAWRIPWTILHGVAKSWTRLSDFHSLTHSLVC